LGQVWTNLVHNALQAMENKGQLSISLQQQDDYAIVAISDTGCGIAPEIRDKIFDPFFTTKRAGEGSGLGLDIVNQIIQKHQGRMELVSEVGKGSTFKIYLPYQTED
jgi:two-component system NtrC family sensor kinase